MPMTPVSTLRVRYAENLAGGHLTATALEAARLRVAALFRMTPEQLLTRPGNIVNTLWLDAASPEAVKLSLLSAAFAELASIHNVGLDEVIAGYAGYFIAQDGHLVQRMTRPPRWATCIAASVAFLPPPARLPCRPG